MPKPVDHDGPDPSRYFLIPRDREGNYVDSAEEIVRANGGQGYTHTARPATARASDSDRLLLLEMKNALPPQVEIVAENPFLILRIDSAEDPDMDLQCACQCGGSHSCGGHGNGIV